MYQALYRKYRPDKFSEVVGQDVIIKTLQNAIKDNKISHAYLFTGPRGTGKTSIAKIFAKTVNCKNIKKISPCNKCVSCTQINNRQSTDIIEIDAASNNGVDEIRELKSKVGLVPNISKYKVYIVDEVHMLTTGAFNALLKTLEEPPSHVIFILATTEPQKIPMTILSRCQRYDFKKIGIDKMAERLKHIATSENIKISEEAIKEIARISDGGMRDSIGILDQVISYKEDDITIEDVHMINGTITQNDLEEFITYLLDKNIEKVFELLDCYNNNGKNLSKLLDEIILFLRNILVYHFIPNYLDKNNISDVPYKKINSKIDIDNISKIINSFNELSQKMKTSSNSKILFEIELLNIMNISKNISREIKAPIVDIKKDNKKASKETVSADKQEKIDKYNKKIEEIKKVRINNVLQSLNKKIILEVKDRIQTLKPYLLDKKYGKLASLLLDGKIKAGSKNGLIYVYTYESDTKIFNNNLLILEKLLKKVCGIEYKLISVSDKEWDLIKNEFNSKNKVYNYIEEKIDINKLYELARKNIGDDMLNMFQDILEYTKEEL